MELVGKHTSDRQVVYPKFHIAVELNGRRWSGTIVQAMLDGAQRLTDILHAVPGLSDRLLSERLKKLESAGIVERRIYPETPVRIEYVLTPCGHELREPFRALHRWAEQFAEKREALMAGDD